MRNAISITGPANNARIGRRAFAAIVLLAAAAVAYWLWFGLTQRSVTTDDGISVLAAQSILEHGYPRLPSGYIYVRGWAPNYLLAGSIAMFGAKDFAIMLPSLLMAVGSLFLVYLLGKDVLGRPWVGVLGAFVLVLLEQQTFYATSPRMYMALQFFTLLAVYGVWKGYVEGRGSAKVVAFVAVGAAILSHEAGVLLAAALPVAVLAVLSLRAGKVSISEFSAGDIAGMAALALTAFFSVAYKLPGRAPAITDFAGIRPGSMGLSLDAVEWVRSLFQWEQAFPFGLTLVLPVLFYLFRAFQAKQLFREQGAVFLVLVVALLAGLLLVATSRRAERLWLFVLPLHGLLVSLGLAELGKMLVAVRAKRVLHPAGQTAFLFLVLTAAGMANVGLLYMTDDAPLARIGLSFGPPCRTLDDPCHPSVEEFYTYQAALIGQEDLVASSNPVVTRYYVGRVTGYVREKRDASGGFSPFDRPTDEYLGIAIIDMPEKAGSLADQRDQAWVILDGRKDWAVSEQMRSSIESNYALFFQRGLNTSYANCFEPPCGGAVMRP